MCISALPAAGAEPAALSRPEQQVLLKIARDTLSGHLNGQPLPALRHYALSAPMQQPAGVFVTLKEHGNGNLRGCIGYIIGRSPLAAAVIDCTVQAATHDKRFAPMKKGDEQNVLIEISVLSPPQKIGSPEQIRVGQHGLIIAQGPQTGLLLPQVAVEHNWSRDDFLKALCAKANLPEDAWKHSADLYVFTAEVFAEERGR